MTTRSWTIDGLLTDHETHTQHACHWSFVRDSETGDLSISVQDDAHPECVQYFVIPRDDQRNDAFFAGLTNRAAPAPGRAD